MKNFTFKFSCLTSFVLALMCAFSISASAFNFEPVPTTFKTTNLNGTFSVLLKGPQDDGMPVIFGSNSPLTLTDEAGNAVAGKVDAEIANNYTLVLTLSGVAEPLASGNYKVVVPAGSCKLMDMPHITGDQFVVTFDHTGSTVDPGPGGETENPEEPVAKNVATFDFTTYKSSLSHYYKMGDQIQSNAEGVNLNFGNVGMENDNYSYCYMSNAGYVQFKDCTFTIEAPVGRKITKVVMENGAPSSYTYLLENLEAAGYSNGVWNGNASAVTFNTAIVQTPIYAYDADDNEYIAGYTEQVSGARVSKIVVTLDGDVEIEETEQPGKDPDEGNENPGEGGENPDGGDENPGSGTTNPDKEDPQPPVVEPEEEVAENVALFDFTKGMVYEKKGVVLVTESTWNDYFESFQLYASSIGTVKPATFTAPAGKVITEVHLVESPNASNYGMYSFLANFDLPGWECVENEKYNEATIVGSGESITLTAGSTSCLIAKAYITFDNVDATGLHTVLSERYSNMNYDLSGRRVNTANGITIKNGRKVIR